MTAGELRFVAATPVWWQAQAGVSFCLELGEAPVPAVEALAEVAAFDGPLPEVLMLAPDTAAPSAEAVQNWLLDHLWLPALVVAGDGGLPALAGRARTDDVRTLSTRPAGLPRPPIELAFRVGDQAGDPWPDFDLIGSECRREILASLPAGWSWKGSRVLDFGCGVGRVLRHFTSELQQGAELHGCDIHEPSIRWMQEHTPQFHAFVNAERPPLDRPDSFFDLVWAMSVFTHLDLESWAGWLLEMHRILKPEGLLVATYLGSSSAVLDEPWNDDHIGINSLSAGNSWDAAGPLTLLSDWWLRAHWGRAFEVVSLRPALGHDMAVLRRRDVSLTEEDLERPEPDEPRELSSARHYARQLYAEAAGNQRGLDEQVSDRG